MHSVYITPMAVDIHSQYLPLHVPNNLLDDLVKKVADKSCLAILEIGPGNGVFIEKLLNSLVSINNIHIDVHLVEPNKYFFNIISSIQQRYSNDKVMFKLYNTDIQSFINETNCSFDIIIANRVINQIEDWLPIANWIKQLIIKNSAIFVFTESKGEIYRILNFNHSSVQNPISTIFAKLYEEYFGNRLYQDRRRGINVCDMRNLVDFFFDNFHVSDYLIEWQDRFKWSDYLKIIENYALYPVYSKYLLNNCFDELKAQEDVGNFVKELRQSLKQQNLNIDTSTSQMLGIKYYLVEK